MGYFKGYVVKFEGRELSSKGAWVAKTILSNGQSTIQVVAWGDKLINRLREISEIDFKVEIDGALIVDLSHLWKFNKGNLNVGLRIGDQTKMRTLGIHISSEEPSSGPIITALTDLTRFGGTVKISGFILIPFRTLHAKERHYGIGALTDGETLKIEMKILKFDGENKNWNFGKKVEAKGCIRRRNIPGTKTPAPAYFEVNDESDIKIIEDDDTEKKEVSFFTKFYDYIK